MKKLILQVFAALTLTLLTSLAFGHIRIYPTDSTYGAREKYTMRVPNEKQVATIRVEGERITHATRCVAQHWSSHGHSIQRQR